MLEFNTLSGADDPVDVPIVRRRGRKPGPPRGDLPRTPGGRFGRKTNIDLRPRLEAIIVKALKYQLDSGKPFVQALAEAMHAKPLEALKVFADYLPQEIHAQVSSTAELHLAAVRQLAMLDAPVIEATPNCPSEGADEVERE